MQNQNDLLVWLQTARPEGWEVRAVEDERLRYRLAVPEGWNAAPLEAGPNEAGQLFRGDHSGERLAVAFMREADPAAALPNRVEADLRLRGYPVAELIPDSDPTPNSGPTMLEWKLEEGGPALRERFGVDELWLGSGLSKFRLDREMNLARLYVVLARRGDLAWRMGLSFLSASMPGSPEEMVIENDHVRAGAIFGPLRFL